MRHIPKTVEPSSISQWKMAQASICPPVGRSYESFSRKKQLRGELVAEQHGLCAYTGAPIDDRIGDLQNPVLKFKAHIEHIKPQAVCKQEMDARGEKYDETFGEDTDFRNLVAALEVQGNSVKVSAKSKTEIFGASAHGDELLPVTPVQLNCERRFVYQIDGTVAGKDSDSRETIERLKLNHPTLQEWRRGAIQAFLPDNGPPSRSELQQLINRLSVPVNGRLTEYSFCIVSYLSFLLRK